MSWDHPTEIPMFMAAQVHRRGLCDDPKRVAHEHNDREDHREGDDGKSLLCDTIGDVKSSIVQRARTLRRLACPGLHQLRRLKVAGDDNENDDDDSDNDPDEEDDFRAKAEAPPPPPAPGLTVAFPAPLPQVMTTASFTTPTPPTIVPALETQASDMSPTKITRSEPSRALLVLSCR